MENETGTTTSNSEHYIAYQLGRSVEHTATAIVDSGAQVCVWGWNQCRAAGFTRNDLTPVKQKLNGVSKSQIIIYGAVLLRLHGTSNLGDHYSAAAIVYVSPDVSGLYISKQVMIQLCIVPEGFPSIGGARQGKQFISEQASVSETENDECPCTPQTLPPGRPKVLSMSLTEENIPRMKQWLLKKL